VRHGSPEDASEPQPVSATDRMNRRGLVAFSAVVESGTGLGLMVVPAVVISLLLGARATGETVAVGRVAGIALLTMGLASWPGRKPAQPGAAAVRALLVYNALVAIYLAHLGAARHAAGVLLWPAVALHVVVALLLAWAWRTGGRSSTA
jgi:hypothetical protein